MIRPIILSIASLVCLGFDHYFRITGFSVQSLVFKGCASLFFVGLVFYSFINCKDRDAQFTKLSKFVILALCFSFAADVMLGLNEVHLMGDIAFIIGFLLFVAAHIMYLVAFSVYGKPKASFFVAVVIMSGALLCFARLTPWFDFEGLFPLICVYAVILSCVVIRSLSFTERSSLHAKLMAAGMILFGISDMLLLFWIFPKTSFPTTASSLIFIISNTCYYVGQLLAAYSISKKYN
ncbi:lysoplasmalogenase family protein [Treponema sp.]|uniref:lysoplasmalogenase family protein n=1 Tax=Treponema sp. TaxID=166 RepID=UPI00298E3430|nr:lysoplasmalogenase family protein [Treponema sp.]MCR5614127.1 lysoplasmalogenase [Treponema sp.]